MKKIFLSLAVVFCVVAAYGQKNSFAISYPIAFPMGDLHDYNSKTSFRGISGEYARQIKSNLHVGIELGWNTFYERVSEKTYTSGTASISGIQYRYTNSSPFIVGAKMIFGKSAAKFYGGLGLGTLYVNRSTDFGLYRFITETWQFCVRPEVGALIPIRHGLAGMAGLKYFGAFNTNDLDGQSYLTFNVGLVFTD